MLSILLIRSKYFAFSDWFKAPGARLILDSQLVLTKFGKCEQCTLDFMVYFPVNEAA